MATLTIRLPDNKHERLKALAKSKGISVNTLIDELSTVALVEFDTANRFKVIAAAGSSDEGLRLLNKLDELSKSKAPNA